MTDPLVVPHLDVDHARGRDMVWCASFDLAWRALCDVLGGPAELRLQRGVDRLENDRALSLVRALNASPIRGDVALPESYLALAGEHTEAWVERARTLLRDRFGDADATLFPSAPTPGFLVAYAYADVRLPFTVPFAPVQGGMSFDGTQVDGFGVWDPASEAERALFHARVEQVVVHHHRFPFESDPEGLHEDEGPSEEFVIELETANRDGRVIVACVLPERTLAGTVAVALSRLRDDAVSVPGARLREQEKLRVPCIDFDATRRYGELRGRGLDNPGFPRHLFGEVLERVHFVLDQGGARVISEALFGGLSLPPRTFDCSYPFLVMVLRRGASMPFLAVWVETAALLRKG
jgi:hypothetical protein